MDNPIEEKKIYKISRVNSEVLRKRKRILNNNKKKQNQNPETKSTDQYGINILYSPKENRKKQNTLKTNISKTGNTSSIIQSSIDINQPKTSSFTNLNNKYFITRLKSPKKTPKHPPINKKLFSPHQFIRKTTENSNNLSSNTYHSNYDDNSSNIERKRPHFSQKKKHLELFNFLEEPEFFDDINIQPTKSNHSKQRTPTIMHNIDENIDENASIYSKAHITQQSIIMLNDLQKEIKKSLIGLSSIDIIGSKIKKKNDFLIGDGDSSDISNKSYHSAIKDNNKIEQNDKDRLRVLQRMGEIYDSLDEEDITISTTYIHPDSKILKVIDFLVFIFSIYNLIYIPFFLVLNDIHCRRGFFINIVNIIEIIMDITYIIDTIIPFFIAYYTLDDILKTNLSEIGSEYLKSYFIIDLCAAIPFKLIFDIYDTKCTDIGYLSAPLYQNNIYYCLLLLKIPKALKAFYHNKISNYISEFLNEYEHFDGCLGLYSGVIIFFACIHIMSCTFIFIGKCQYPGWIIRFGFENSTFVQLYLIAIYYIITTCTTVGYGDLTCITLVEKLFGLVMEIVGIFAYSFAVSAISNYVKIMNDKTEKYREKSEILEDIKMSYPDLSEELYMEIHRYLKFKFKFHETLDNKVIINSLPLTLKNTLVCEMYNPIIQNFVFFRNFNNIDFIVKVILSFKPILAIRNDILIKDGDFVEDIIFVKKGRLSLELPIRIEEKEINKSKTLKTKLGKDIGYSRTNKSLRKSKTILINVMTHDNDNIEEENEDEDENITYYKILDIRKNEHFGDILMFLNKRSSLRVKVKSRKAELFYLNKKDAIEISQSYSQIWKKINKKSLFNWEQIKRLMIKISKIFTRENGITEENSHNNILFTTDIPDVSELQSIPSLTNLTVEGDDKAVYKSSQLVRENTLKNKDVGQLNTIEENNSIEVIQESQNEESHNKTSRNNETFIETEYENDNNCEIKSNYSNLKTLKLKTKRNNNISDESEFDSQNSISNDFNDDEIKQTSEGLINTVRVEDSRKKIDFSEKYSENTLEKNIFSLRLNHTPFKPNEINNEIYPDETFVAYSTSNKETTTKKLQQLYLSSKNLDTLSVCSTEISFSINSEYENIEELSDYKYSKSPVMQRKVREFVTGTEYKYKSSLKAQTYKKTIVRKKTSFAPSNLKKVSTFHSKEEDDEIKENTIEDENSEIKENNNRNLFKNPTIKKSNNNKKNLLNVIHQNIERNYMNLNDPDMFYNEFFKKIFDKRKDVINGKIEENPFNEDDEELLKKFDDVNSDDYENKSPLEKFNAILGKL